MVERRFRIACGSAVLAGLVGLGGCTAGGEDARASESADAIAVRVAQVVDTTVALPVVAAGTVAPRDEIALSFKVGGVVARVTVDAGDRVQAGQVLAELDLREFEAALAGARSAAAKAERDLERARRLYADSVLAPSRLEEAETLAAGARAGLAAATVNRDYAVITAPAAGTILRRFADPGELVAPGSPVLLLGAGQRDRIVRAGLADRDAVRIQLGDPAVVRFAAWPDRTFEGVVSRVGAAADPGTGTYTVDIELRDAGQLPAGLVGEVEIRPARGERVALIPVEAALEADGDVATVFVVSPDGLHATRRHIRIGFLLDRHVAVTHGLDGVSTVVTDGAAYLYDGAPLRVSP